MSDAGASDPSTSGSRPVVRAACLNCRSAKRRCDGVQPHCGPCVSRGIDASQCQFVSSKRGGPRYKGIKGADAARIKAEKDRHKELQQHMQHQQSQQSILQGTGPIRSRPGPDSSMHQQPQHFYHAQPAPPGHPYPQGYQPGPAQQYPAGHHPAHFAPPPSHFQPAPQHPGYPGPHLQSLASHPTPMRQGQSPDGGGGSSNSSAASQAAHGVTNSLASGTGNGSSPTSDSHMGPSTPSSSPGGSNFDPRYPGVLPFGARPPPDGKMPESMNVQQYGYEPDSNDGLSFANLQLWQRIQDAADSSQDTASPGVPMSGDTLRDFFAKLESLPKAGVVGMVGAGMGHDSDMHDVEGRPAVDNDQQARMLLTAFFNHIYPSCPVLLPPSNLSSLAFYFSGKGPCALFSAISALVALHVPSSEAQRTLRSADAAAAGGVMTQTEIAAHHAKTSAGLLRSFDEMMNGGMLEPCEKGYALGPGEEKRVLCAGSPDLELLQIEAAAAHTLLAHYYYGCNAENGHLRAYQHAAKAWEDLQALDVKGRTEWGGFTERTAAQSGHTFSAAQKEEWAKRVYWATYSAATVMSCTGGFDPLKTTVDALTDLRLRPVLDGDNAAWGVLIRGAQHVSRTYRLLFDFEQLRGRAKTYARQLALGHADPEQGQRLQEEGSAIFSGMMKIDNELLNYTRFDPSWRKVEEPVMTAAQESIERSELQLGQSLRFAGKLMTSGAMIILHRAQAFSNARVFIESTCGVPEAARHDSSAGCTLNAPDRLWHRSEADPTQMDADVVGRPAGPPMPFASANGDQTHEADDMVIPAQYAGGPFEPSVSQDRCRLASATMVAILHPLLVSARAQPKAGSGLETIPDAPRLPPYSACSFVLSAYAILMECLLIQVTSAGGAAEPEAKRKVVSLRGAVRDVKCVLDRFATTWDIAKKYSAEVSMLLAANESLGV